MYGCIDRSGELAVPPVGSGSEQEEAPRRDLDSDGVNNSCHICDTNGDGAAETCYTCDSNDDGVKESCVKPIGISGPDVVCIDHDATFTVSATPSWYHLVAWSGGDDPASGSGATYTTKWTSTGEKVVRATSGQCSFEKTVTVVQIASIEGRRTGSGDAFGSSATIAAGGYSSDVHKADVEMTIAPLPTVAYTVDCPVSLANAEGYLGEPPDNVRAKLYMGGSLVVEGNGTGYVTFSSPDGKATGYLQSSNLGRTCTISSGLGSAQVTFAWDTPGGGAYDYEFPDYFVPGIADTVKFFATLQEVSGLDEDGDGTGGEGLIDLHEMKFYTRRIEVKCWKWDMANGVFLDGPRWVELENTEDDNPEVVYGARTPSEPLFLLHQPEHGPGRRCGASFRMGGWLSR